MPPTVAVPSRDAASTHVEHRNQPPGYVPAAKIKQLNDGFLQTALPARKVCNKLRTLISPLPTPGSSTVAVNDWAATSGCCYHCNHSYSTARAPQVVRPLLKATAPPIVLLSFHEASDLACVLQPLLSYDVCLTYGPRGIRAAGERSRFKAIDLLLPTATSKQFAGLQAQ